MLNATVEEEIYVLEPVAEEELAPRPRRFGWAKKLGLVLLGATQIGVALFGALQLVKRLRG